MHIKIGTRGSDLAIKQANLVADAFKKFNNNITIEIIPIKTTGDILHSANLMKIGGKAVFLKEIEESLLEGKIDCAVHSAKDVPAFLHKDLEITGVLPRVSALDCMLSKKHKILAELPTNAVIGTSSIRREVQLLKLRSDLQVKPIRGNVLTRIQKMKKGEYDAIILAKAALQRLKIEDMISQEFSADEIIPAVGQGIICIETRKEQQEINEIVCSISDKHTFTHLQAERYFMQGVEGNCSMPMGAHVTEITKGRFEINAMFSSSKKNIKFGRLAFSLSDMESKIKKLAYNLKNTR